MIAGTPSLEIVAAGLRTVLGSGCYAAAMRARAARFTARRTALLDARGRPVRMGIVRELPDDLFGLERLISLAVPPLWEVTAASAAALGRSDPLPLWLSLPEAWRGYDDPRLDGEVIDRLTRASGVAIDRARSGVVRSGRAGGAEAVERAAAMWEAAIAEGAAPAAVMVGGVDSAYGPAAIAALEPEEGEGELPAFSSEGAAFVVLAPPPGRASQRGRADPALAVRARADAAAAEGPLVHCVGAAIWRPDPLSLRPPPSRPGGAGPSAELPDPLSDIDFIAARIEVLRRAMGGGRAGWALPDVNDDPERALEWWDIVEEAGLQGAAQDHLTGRIGDVGAATGAAFMAIAWAWWKAGCGRAPSAVIALASDDGPCGAIALASGSEPAQRP